MTSRRTDEMATTVHQLVSELETPALLADVPAMERNIETYVDFAEENDVTLRSHVKTHKNAELAALEDELTGGGGICCQTLGEVDFQTALDAIHERTRESYGVAPASTSSTPEHTPAVSTEVDADQTLDVAMAEAIRTVQVNAGVYHDNGWVAVSAVDDELMARLDEEALDEHTVETLTDRLADMTTRIRDWEDEFGVESPNQLRGTLADDFLDADEEDRRREIAREWEHLQRRIQVVGFALREWDFLAPTTESREISNSITSAGLHSVATADEMDHGFADGDLDVWMKTAVDPIGSEPDSGTEGP